MISNFRLCLRYMQPAITYGSKSCDQNSTAYACVLFLVITKGMKWRLLLTSEAMLSINTRL